MLGCFLWSHITLVSSSLSVVVNLVASCFVSKAPGEMEGMFPLLKSVILWGGIGKNKPLNATTDWALPARHHSGYTVQIWRMLSHFLHAFTSVLYLPAVKLCMTILRGYNLISEFLQVMWESPCCQSQLGLEVRVVIFRAGIVRRFLEIFFYVF